MGSELGRRTPVAVGSAVCGRLRRSSCFALRRRSAAPRCGGNPLRSFTSKVLPSKRRRADCAGSSGDLLPPSLPTEKTRLPGARVVRGGGSALKGKKTAEIWWSVRRNWARSWGKSWLACRRDRCANLVKKSKVWLFHPQRKFCETAALR